MNNNRNNQKGKGARGGAMQNQGNRENENLPGSGGKNQNKVRENENQRMESRSQPINDSEKGIHPVDSPPPQSPNQRKEPQRMESGMQQIKDREKQIHPVGEPSPEKKLSREKETHRMVSWNRNIPESEMDNQLKSSTKKVVNLENETLKRELRNREKTNTFDNLTNPPPKANTMSDKEPAYKTSTILENASLGAKDQLIDKSSDLGTALYVIAALLLVGWAIGFFFYDAGAAIHVLLVLALAAVLFRVVQGRAD